MDNVEVVERGNIVVNIYEGQKGATGEAGKSLRFEDLTPEQKAELKGEKGDKGDNANVEPVYHLLVNRGYLPASNSLTDVLTYIVDHADNFRDKLEGLELTLERQPQYGDTVLMVRCSHIEGMVIKERGFDKTYTISNETDWVFPIELSHSMDEREVVLDAIWQGEVKSTLVVEGVSINNIPKLTNGITLATGLFTEYKTALADNYKTLYFESPQTSGNMTPIVDLLKEAYNNDDIPNSIETLVLHIGRPINLDNMHQYPVTTINKMFASHNDAGSSNITIPPDSLIIDLTSLNVPCKNVVIVSLGMVQTSSGEASSIYVISNKQKTITTAQRVGTDYTNINTVNVKNVSVTQIEGTQIHTLVTDATVHEV